MKLTMRVFKMNMNLDVMYVEKDIQVNKEQVIILELIYLKLNKIVQNVKFVKSNIKQENNCIRIITKSITQSCINAMNVTNNS